MKIGSTECKFCDKKKNPKNRGKLTTRKHLTLDELPFHELWDLYLKKLADKKKSNFKFHPLKFLSLDKDFITDVRRKSLQQGEDCIGHDFTEAVCIQHNEEIHSNHLVEVQELVLKDTLFTIQNIWMVHL